MSRARELFDRLRQGGTTALDALIADREPESLFLDFKRSEDDGQGGKLANSDNKNLSKAISGFANSSGGVVVWGVDCRRDASGNEAARPHCVVDAKGFETKLQSAVSRATMPAFSGVEFHAFVQAEGNLAGFVAMYVPQSLIGPIRAVIGDQYHIRAGSDFVPTPHDVLAGMFGRAPQANIDVNLIHLRAALDGLDGRLTAIVGIVAVNVGSVMGERPYLSIAWGDFPQEALKIQSMEAGRINVRRGMLPCASVIADSELVLAPGGAEHLCNLTVTFDPSAPRPLNLEVVLGVAGVPPQRFKLAASIEDIGACTEGARQAGGALRSTPIKIVG